MPIVPNSVVPFEEFFTDLRYPGWRITGGHTDNDAGEHHIYLEPKGDAICPVCGRLCSRIHDSTDRRVRDMSVTGAARLTVHLNVRRVRCSCGCRQSEKISWLEPHARITNGFVSYIQALLRLKLPISEISKHTGIRWGTIKYYDKLQLGYFFRNIDVSKVKHLAIDEFAVFKGHHYATVAMDVKTCQVIWVGQGKTQKSLEPFFEMLREKGVADQIETVSCDMNAAYPRMVKEHLPKAKVLYDLFHVMAHFTKDVLAAAKKAVIAALNLDIRDSLRQKKNTKKGKKAEETPSEQSPATEQASGESERKARAVDPADPPASSERVTGLRGSEWLLVRRANDLTVEKQERLDRILKDNALLSALYPLVQYIRDIWTCPDATEAGEKIEDLRNILFGIKARFNFAAAGTFAKMLKRRKEGIIHTGTYQLGTGRLEGANNKIKVCKRTAYGYRDFEYFVLKIKSQLPGKQVAVMPSMKTEWAVLESGTWVPEYARSEAC